MTKKLGKTEKMKPLKWRVHVPNLLKEIINSNPSASALAIPINILFRLLEQVAQRATELNDPKLNQLMLRLALYSVADPTCPDYDAKLTNKLIDEEL